MKNIHILPTDKPSRFFEILQFNFVFDNQNKYSEEYKKLHKYKNKNIYITSDEEIKEGDCFLEKAGRQFPIKWDGKEKLNFHSKKIILTTDQDLIKDGVQAIDDEFLEWYVKNPNCEEVEVIYGLYNPMGRKVSNEKVSENHSQCVWKYKIIIPKEETLEDVAEKYAVNKSSADVFRKAHREDFINGGKWQQDQDKNKYSEEDMLLAFETGRNFQLTGENNFKELIEQLKK